MFVLPTSWEVQALVWTQNLRLAVWYREHLNREPPAWLTTLANVSVWCINVGSVLIAVFLLSRLNAIGLAAFIAAFFVSTAYHELGHYRAMLKYGITPENVGIGLWFGPFKHFQIKFKFRIKKLDDAECELWIQPLTFMLVAYVNEGEAGREEIAKLGHHERTEIYGAGVVNNLIFALVAWSVIVFSNWEFDLSFVELVLIVAVTLILTVAVTSGKPKLRRLNLVMTPIVLIMVAVGVWQLSFNEVPDILWPILSFALAAFLLLYKPIVTSRAFPLIGLAVAGWLLYELYPPLFSDPSVATARGGSLEGEPALLLGPRSMMEMFALSEGEPSERLVWLLGDGLANVWASLGKSWQFVPWISMTTSLGFALVNLLPVISTDGGYMWADFLDPKFKHPQLRKWGLRIPTALILPLLLVTLVRTEVGDIIAFTILAVAAIVLVAKFIGWRIRLAKVALWQRRALADPGPVARL